MGSLEAHHPHGTQPIPKNDGFRMSRELIYHRLQAASQFVGMEMEPGLKDKSFHVGWQHPLHFSDHSPTGYYFCSCMTHCQPPYIL